MSPRKEIWTEGDFDEMSWHDNHVHGIQIREGEHGTGTLILDIDYIVEWRTQGEKHYEFLIAPADLTFREVMDLRIALDYASPTAALTPFSIQAIRRESISYSSDPKSYRWTIEINWPVGEITFVAKGFAQKLRGRLVVNETQSLRPDQRTAHG